MAKLEVNNLTISFRTNNGAVRAVRDISFKLDEGETLAIVGESGSGKSVTARAVMGILAGNAIVDGGSIIYDGRDLLKIPEEEFHTLRGHRLAMVFQDPLSALNPIMRIGRQLTEAMLVNNRERRKDGKLNFNRTLDLLEKRINEAYAAKGEKHEAEVRNEIGFFNELAVASVKLQRAFDNAQETGVKVCDAADALEILIAGGSGDLKAKGEALADEEKQIYNEYYIPAGTLRSQFEAVAAITKSYSVERGDELKNALESLKAEIKKYDCVKAPDFTRIAYTPVNGRSFDEEMGNFAEKIALALEYSHERTVRKKSEVIKCLTELKKELEKDKLDKAGVYAAARSATHEVEDVIDRLDLDKDNLSYIFKSGIMTGLKRYFKGVKTNPGELRRFEKDSIKHDKLERKGKFAPSVVPLNIIDTDAVRLSLIKTVDDLITLYSSRIKETEKADYSVRAAGMVEYLKKCASEYAYTLTQTMAKHRAIELMREVGIPQPEARYNQFPFEFSGGMRQRIVIAIALSANPDVLICDEPTTALDVTIQAQILELINELKVKRNLSVIFITHDLGVVANIADRVAVMYAGKIVELGTTDDVFYSPAHPYTWALLSSMPDVNTQEKLDAIPGTPPDMIYPPKGDAFAARNQYAMQIDFEMQPPMFEISDTHTAATWLLHPDAPKVNPPRIVTERIERMRKLNAEMKKGEV